MSLAASLPIGPNWMYNQTRPLIIANGGSSGHFPENSLAAYMDAYLSGADFIKLTVQMTSD
jgi:glycerophosphoryl diester phosphodiesterase